MTISLNNNEFRRKALLAIAPLCAAPSAALMSTPVHAKNECKKPSELQGVKGSLANENGDFFPGGVIRYRRALTTGFLVSTYPSVQDVMKNASAEVITVEKEEPQIEIASPDEISTSVDDRSLRPASLKVSHKETVSREESESEMKTSAKTKVTSKASSNVNDITEFWMKRYSNLVEYKSQFGHCDIPRYCKSNLQLGGWVERQRQFKKNGTLSGEKIALLERIGFAWSKDPERTWRTHYNDLVTYKRQFGHCAVPSLYKPNPILARWVTKQRANKKKRKLSEKRIAQLNQIGFVWEIFCYK